MWAEERCRQAQSQPLEGLIPEVRSTLRSRWLFCSQGQHETPFQPCLASFPHSHHTSQLLGSKVIS